MIFKDNDRLKKEFWEVHPKIRAILCDVDLIAKQHAEEAVVTCLIRTEEEQRKLFEDGQAPLPTSVHMFGRGADIRKFKSNALNLVVVEYVLDRYPYQHSGKPSALQHEGTAEHLHFQVWEIN